MPQVDTMKTLQGWTESGLDYFGARYYVSMMAGL
jgi:hypothetical protein